MKKIVLVLILVLFPALGFAGEYVLLKGKGVEVCEEYKKNLERLNIPDSAMCQIWMWDYKQLDEYKMWGDPEMSGDSKYDFSNNFMKLTWKRLDLKNKKLIRSFLIYRGGSLYDNNTLVDEEINAIELHKDDIYEVALYTVSIDLDNDGKKETVLLYRDGVCPTNRAFSADIYILSKNRSTIDVNHPIQKLIEKGIEESGGKNRAVHVFQYKKKAYIDKYCGDWGSEIIKQVEHLKSKGKPDDIKDYSRRGCREDNTLSVYSISKGAMEEVCKYQYKNNK